jgi:hypothetical protein
MEGCALVLLLVAVLGIIFVLITDILWWLLPLILLFVAAAWISLKCDERKQRKRKKK